MPAGPPTPTPGCCPVSMPTHFLTGAEIREDSALMSCACCSARRPAHLEIRQQVIEGAALLPEIYPRQPRRTQHLAEDAQGLQRCQPGPRLPRPAFLAYPTGRISANPMIRRKRRRFHVPEQTERAASQLAASRPNSWSMVQLSSTASLGRRCAMGIFVPLSH